MRKYLLSENGSFYKANLHCHSTYSDGSLTPEELKELYKANGYSIIAYTDHDIMIDHSDLADDKFLPLMGYEMEINGPLTNTCSAVDFSGHKTCHLCYISLDPDNKKQVCWHRSKYLFGNAPKHINAVQFYEDEPDYERVYGAEGISDMIKKGRDHGFFVTYNHPSWSLEDYSDYTSYEGLNAMEICNFGCVITGYLDYDQQSYDDMLRTGHKIFCLATDDNHNRPQKKGTKYYDSCGGWVMIKADRLEYREITKNLENGNFYSSQGPEINELYFEDGKLFVKCSGVEKIIMSTGRRRTEFLIAPDGEVLTEAALPVFAEDGYVRVTVVDYRGKPANTNAYFTDELFAD